MGFVLMVTYRIFHQPLWFSVTVCLLVPSLMGFVKEWDDSREPGNRWDWGDIRDNEIGVSVGVAVGSAVGSVIVILVFERSTSSVTTTSSPSCISSLSSTTNPLLL